jgi:hypothetical protein
MFVMNKNIQKFMSTRIENITSNFFMAIMAMMMRMLMRMSK